MKAEHCPFHGTMCEFIPVARSTEDLRARLTALETELAQYRSKEATIDAVLRSCLCVLSTMPPDNLNASFLRDIYHARDGVFALLSRSRLTAKE